MQPRIINFKQQLTEIAISSSSSSSKWRKGCQIKDFVYMPLNTIW